MDYNQGKETSVNIKNLYIIIALLLLLNLGQFVYFYKVVIELKSELRIKEYKINKESGKYNNL
jgi:hypothetical protein